MLLVVVMNILNYLTISIFCNKRNYQNMALIKYGEHSMVTFIDAYWLKHFQLHILFTVCLNTGTNNAR